MPRTCSGSPRLDACGERYHHAQMRSSLLAIAILTSAASLVALSGGCKKKEKAAEQQASETEQKARERAARDSRKLGRYRSESLGSRLGLQQVTMDEIKPMVPQLENATPLGEPNTTAGGRRITAIHCLTDAADLKKIQAQVEAKLTELGFANIKSKPHGKQDVMTISADKPPYRLAATVRRGPFPECPADQNKVKLLMSYFKRMPPKPRDGAPGQLGQPGAAPAQTGAAPAPAPAAGATKPQ
jgi:hypothetical protein